MDLFVMIISIGLASRFKQINEDLQRVKGQVNQPSDIINVINVQGLILFINIFENKSAHVE